MAKITTDDSHYKGIANEIRTLVGSEDEYKPAEMVNTLAQSNESVAAQGETIESIKQAIQGKTGVSGYDRGYDAGRQAEWDAFWDAYQQNGKRSNYNSAFYGDGWNDTTFKPKYDIAPTGRNNGGMFAYSAITDIKGILEKQGVKLDLSLCNSETQFTWALNTRLPVMDYSASTGVSFYYSYKLKSIDKIILKQDGSQAFNFAGATSLKDVVFEGVIGQNIDLSACPLSKNSIESVFSAFSTTATEKTATFRQSAVNTAFETSAGLADGSTSPEWLALVATKSNWTITLA